MNKDYAFATASCKTGNVAAGVTKTGTAAVATVGQCGMKTLDNDMFVWVDDALITCTSGIGSAATVATGAENCWYDYKSETGSWKPKATTLSRDHEKFRTVGKTVGTDINDSDINCWDADFKNIVEGAAECWPFEVNGQDLFSQKQYVWLNQPSCYPVDPNGVTATALSSILKGTANCKQTNTPTAVATCNDFVKLNADQTCLPNFTWVAK